jgi:serine/threonine protein kinase/WD40 repeat protein
MDKAAQDALADEIIEHCVRQRLAGEIVSDEDIIAAHPELTNELLVRLRQLGRIEAAKKQADTPEFVRFELLRMLRPATDRETLGKIGAFDVLSILGYGGMGIVVEARDLTLDRKVAIKLMRPAAALSTHATERFCREARAIAKLHHDNIVPVLHATEDNGITYIVMPLLKGETLGARMHRMQRIPWQDVVQIAKQVCLGLAEAHRHGLIHRDIKPTNLWIEPCDGAVSFRIRILDFGLAKLEEDDFTLTHEGAILGTAAYMSPEQANGEVADHRSDLYSLGATMYHLIAGRTCFRTTSFATMIRAVTGETPVSLIRLGVPVDQALSDLVDDLLRKAPAARPSDAAVVFRRLTDIEGCKPRSKNRVKRIALVGCLCVLLMGVATSLLFLLRNEEGLTKRLDNSDDSPTVGDSITRVGVTGYFGLVPDPLPLNDAHVWQIETVSPRAAERLAISGDGEYFAVPDGRNLRIYRARDFRLIHICFGHQDNIASIAWHPHNSLVATGGGSDDAVIRVWDAATGIAGPVLSGHSDSISALAWSGDGMRLASGGSWKDAKVRVWNVERGDSNVFQCSSAIADLCWGVRDDSLLVLNSGGSQGVSELYFNSRRSFARISPASGVSAIAKSSSGKWLAVATKDHLVELWDCEKWQKQWSKQTERSFSNDLAWHSDSQMFVEANQDGSVSMWNTEGVLATTVSDGRAPARAVAWAGNDSFIVLRWPAQITVHAHGDLAVRRGMGFQRRPAPSLVWNPKTDAILTAAGRTIITWDSLTGRPIASGDCGSNIIDLSVMNDGDGIVVAGSDGTVQLFGPDLKTLRIIGRHPRKVHAVAARPMSSQLVSSGPDGLRLWDSKDASLQRVVIADQPIGGIAWNSDGSWLAAVANDKLLKLSPSTDQQEEVQAARYRLIEFTNASWSPNNERIAVGGIDSKKAVYDARILTEARKVGRVVPSPCVSWSPDSAEIATIDGANVAIYSHMENGVRWLRGHGGPIAVAAYGKHKRRLATIGTDRTLRLWNPDSGNVLWLSMMLDSGKVVTLDERGKEIKGLDKESRSEFVVAVKNAENFASLFTIDEFEKTYGVNLGTDK